MSRLISIQLTPKAPVTEPVSLEQAKDFLRIDFPDDDAVISRLITASRQRCEKYLGLCLVETEVKALYRNGGTMVELAYGPIETDTDGLPIISGDDGQITGVKGFGNQIWIETDACELSLSYTSKFDPVPDWAIDAILNDVAYFYEHRGDETIDRSKIAAQTMDILYSHRTTLHEFFI